MSLVYRGLARPTMLCHPDGVLLYGSIAFENVSRISGLTPPPMLCHPAGVLLTYLISLF